MNLDFTDRELLELAAKAAGIAGRYAGLDDFPDWMTAHDGEGIYYTGSQAWNPLTDDGDAFRLMVALRIDVIQQDDDIVVAAVDGTMIEGSIVVGRSDATRRAIVRAAAEIGRRMRDE